MALDGGKILRGCFTESGGEPDKCIDSIFDSEVKVCRCSTDLCNKGNKFAIGSLVLWGGIFSVVWKCF